MNNLDPALLQPLREQMSVIVASADVTATALIRDDDIVSKGNNHIWRNATKTSLEALDFVALAALTQAVVAELSLTQEQRDERAARIKAGALYAARTHAANRVASGDQLTPAPYCISAGAPWQGCSTSTWTKEVIVDGGARFKAVLPESDGIVLLHGTRVEILVKRGNIMSKSNETGTAAADCKCKRIGDWDGVRHHFLCDEASEAERAAWLQSRPTPEDRMNAHAQQLRYALRSLQRIAQGEPDAAKFAAESIKHIVGIAVSREMLAAQPAAPEESLEQSEGSYHSGAAAARRSRWTVWKPMARSYRRWLRTAILSGKEKVASVSNKYTETNNMKKAPPTSEARE